MNSVRICVANGDNLDNEDGLQTALEQTCSYLWSGTDVNHIRCMLSTMFLCI